ncbi:RepB family protein [Escherichia coli]|uniref:RepB family protein n=1 Tax=Escherichia coli TaxID=562 RepID=UPI003D160B3C
MSEAERQRAASARKRSVCKEIKVFVRPELKKLPYQSVCRGRGNSGRVDRKAYRERGLSPEHDVMGSHSC